MTQRSQLDDLVHRVNNLLGTIEIQAELARSAESPAAYAEAIGLIVESARRTRAEMLRITAGTADSVGDEHAASDGR